VFDYCFQSKLHQILELEQNVACCVEVILKFSRDDRLNK